MSTRDFLVELGTEELPPLALPELQAAFAEGVRKGLVEASLGFAALRSYAAPRRLAVLVEALATQQPVQDIRRRGPPVNAAFDKDGKPTRAAAAFAESCGVAVESLERAREGKGEFLFFTGSKPGQPAASLLPGIVQAALDALPIPKRMRWGSSDAEFVRPVHWLVMLLGSEVVPARILDTDSGSTTRGHRFHAPEPLAIDVPAHYAALLRERGHVLADFAERRERIRSQVLQKATVLGGRPVMSDALLDEVTALVEWPVAIAGRFEERFLALPREVLISTLQDHQRYFPVEDANGQLTPWFITASNIESRDPTRVREGNERVVRPRLSDAAFFWDQDRREPLAARIPALDAVTFQAKLGSVGEKSRRVQALAAAIAASPASARGASIGASEARVTRAAALAKCDLLSAMVGEFPELQGVMGAYYAAADGEDGEVATAIREHYLPRGAGDALPTTPTGLTVALADKIDTLAGIFAIGQKPSGTKDPFGLRRAAIGSLRILLEKRLELDLRALVSRSVAAQPVANPAAATEVLDYILERLRAVFLDAGRGITTEMYDAVLASGSASPLDLDARLAALGAFLAQPEGASLAAANKRIANILKKSEPQAASGAAVAAASMVATPGGAASREAAPVDAAALVEPAEKALHAAVEALRADVTAALARGDYAAALTRLAALRPTVDAFFDGVMVNDPDARLRANRLALLGGVRALFAGVADLSKLPG